MKKSFYKLCLLLCSIIILTSGMMFIYKQIAKLSYEQENQSDFTVKSEERRGSMHEGIWTVDLLLSPQTYSKNRIEEIFNHYSQKYPDRNERLRIYIFTNEAEWVKERNTPPYSPVLKKEDLKKSNFESYAKAMYYRPNNTDMTNDLEEIRYIFSPNLNNPDTREIYIYKNNAWVKASVSANS